MLEIKKVTNELMAIDCDKLLTKLIQSERRFDDNIKETFQVENYYTNKFAKEHNVLFLAYYDSVPVGYIFGYIKDHAGEFVHNSVAHIDTLYVLDEYRKRGIATSLMNEFYNWCNEYAIKFVNIGVFKDNLDAYNLYRKEGFEIDTYYMTKEL